MGDEEAKVRRLAELMGLEISEFGWVRRGSQKGSVLAISKKINGRSWIEYYNPYHDPAQAFGLLERFPLYLTHDTSGPPPWPYRVGIGDGKETLRGDLKTAICDAVVAAHKEGCDDE